MGNKVVKFGGSSLADANQFRKVAAIIKSDEKRKYVISFRLPILQWVCHRLDK